MRCSFPLRSCAAPRPAVPAREAKLHALGTTHFVPALGRPWSEVYNIDQVVSLKLSVM